MCRQCKARQARACVRDFGIPPPRRRRRSGTRTAALFFQTSRAPHCAPHGIFRYSFLRDKNEGSQRRFPRQARKARAFRRRCLRLRESRDRRRGEYVYENQNRPHPRSQQTAPFRYIVFMSIFYHIYPSMSIAKSKKQSCRANARQPPLHLIRHGVSPANDPYRLDYC